MYTPALYREHDRGRLCALIEAHNFGTLIVPDGDSLEISHLPFLLDRERSCLLTHVARGNRVWRLAQEGRTATVVFHGPHSYVSARWYEHPEEHVPTWNYAVVHATGRLSGPMGKDALVGLLDGLTKRHEPAGGWSRAVTEPGFVDQLLEGIVGFELRIERLEGKLKLSQNRTPTDRARVIAALESAGPEGASVASLMRTVLELDA